MHVRDKSFAVRHLARATGEGLYGCVKKSLTYMGVEWRSKMVGLGCDGTNTNIGSDSGLKSYLLKDIPWLVVSWYFAHRLELSIKDPLKDTYFKEIDQLLLQIYYVYDKSPKKCHELKEIVDNLKECLTETEMPMKGGTRPLRACGTRFVSHKVAALARLIDRYGAYPNHLTMLSQDRKVKSADREKLKGYVLRWRKSKILLACALFHDVLKSIGVLSKILQEEELCNARATEAFLRTKKSLQELKVKNFEDFPTVKKVLGRIQQKEACSGSSTTVTYQDTDLHLHPQALSSLSKDYKVWLNDIGKCLVSRMKAQDEELVLYTHAMRALVTQGWERRTSSFGHYSLEGICDRFTVPLEKADIDVSTVQDEWDEYSKQYLNLVQNDYKVIWWKLFNSVDAKRWCNVLGVVELLFCLPLSNGHLKSIFSQLKIIKHDRRTHLSEDRLDQLVRIKVDGPPVEKWDASDSLNVWYKEKSRTVTTTSRVSTSNASAHQSASGDDESEPFSMDEWKQWMQMSIVGNDDSDASLSDELLEIGTDEVVLM